MEGRKWEEFQIDCLVKIFSKTGLASLLFDIPLVCKHWYKATLNPLCWQNLQFPEPCFWSYDCGDFEMRLSALRNALGLVDLPAQFSTTEFRIPLGLVDLLPQISITEVIGLLDLPPQFSTTELIKFVIDRSKGSATDVYLPTNCTEEALVYVANKCPNLQKLALFYGLDRDLMMKLPVLISKWKNLMVLFLGGNMTDLQPILEQISLHCKNFLGLNVRCYISKDSIFAIAMLLPNIKYLILECVCKDFKREDLVKILKCCKELVYFIVKGEFYFEVDDEIRKLASHIKRFECE